MLFSVMFVRWSALVVTGVMVTSAVLVFTTRYGFKVADFVVGSKEIKVDCC